MASERVPIGSSLRDGFAINELDTGSSYGCDGTLMVDADLITRAARGDTTAFQALVEQHRSMVYRVAYQFAGNHYDAEDITQDVFIKVYRSLPRFRLDAQFTSWIYRIAMNACIDHRRRQPTAAVVPITGGRRSGRGAMDDGHGGGTTRP